VSTYSRTLETHFSVCKSESTMLILGTLLPILFPLMPPPLLIALLMTPRRCRHPRSSWSRLL
jgi:hypothetical protein